MGGGGGRISSQVSGRGSRDWEWGGGGGGGYSTTDRMWCQSLVLWSEEAAAQAGRSGPCGTPQDVWIVGLKGWRWLLLDLMYQGCSGAMAEPGQVLGSLPGHSGRLRCKTRVLMDGAIVTLIYEGCIEMELW